MMNSPGRKGLAGRSFGRPSQRPNRCLGQTGPHEQWSFTEGTTVLPARRIYYVVTPPGWCRQILFPSDFFQKEVSWAEVL